MKTVTLEKEDLIARAADLVQQMAEEKPDAVFCFSCSSEFSLLSKELSKRIKDRKLNLSQARFVQAEELPESGEAIAAWMKAEFYDPCGISKDQILFLSVEDAPQYDERIAQWGGLDLAVPSLGRKGQLCLNEASAGYDSATHEQKLTEALKEELSAVLKMEKENLGERGLTVGIQTLVSAGKILVLAIGEEKEKAVFQTLYARDDGLVPSAFLQLPREAFVFCDPDAAKSL